MNRYIFLYLPKDSTQLHLIGPIPNEHRVIPHIASEKYHDIFSINKNFYLIKSIGSQRRLVIDQRNLDMTPVNEFTIELEESASAVRLLSADAANDKPRFLLSIAQSCGRYVAVLCSTQNVVNHSIQLGEQEIILHGSLGNSSPLVSLTTQCADRFALLTLDNALGLQRVGLFAEMPDDCDIYDCCCIDPARELFAVDGYADDAFTQIVNARGAMLKKLPRLRPNAYFHFVSQIERLVYCTHGGIVSVDISDFSFHIHATSEIDDAQARFSRNDTSNSICAIIQEPDGPSFVSIEGARLQKIATPPGNGLGRFCHYEVSP